MKKLAVIKFWNDRSDYDPQQFFEKVERVKIDFADVQYLLKEQDHPKKEEIRTRILENYGYLSELDTELEDIRSDNRKHRKDSSVRQLIKRLK